MVKKSWHVKGGIKMKCEKCGKDLEIFQRGWETWYWACTCQQEAKK